MNPPRGSALERGREVGQPAGEVVAQALRGLRVVAALERAMISSCCATERSTRAGSGM